MRQLLVLATTLAAVTLAAACVSDPQTEREFLFGLDEVEILEAAANYETDADLLLAQLASPFDCEQLGDLCLAVGPKAAEQLLWRTWELMDERAPLDEIEQEMMVAIDVAEEAWEQSGPSVLYHSVESNNYLFYQLVAGGTWFRIRTRAKLYKIGATMYAKGKVWHHAQGTTGGPYYLSPANLDVSVWAQRNRRGRLTTKICAKAGWGSSKSCYRTFGTGGTHRIDATGEANGRAAFAQAFH